MLKFKRFFSVPYSVEQMFTLVNDVTSYSKFIPGCISSKILEQFKNSVVVELNVYKFGINESFVTCNEVVHNKSIVMRLVRGPFRFLFGYWYFFAVNDVDCNSIVQCCFNFEFTKKFFYSLFSSVFINQSCNAIMNSFIDRARYLYGY